MKSNFKKLKRQVKGITLVALVVTIIILLILAGVAISLSLGEDGIFKRAQESSMVYENASGNEKIEIDKVSNYIDNLNGIQNMSEVEKAIKKGTVYKENTTIYDKYNNPVKVPQGFKLAKDSGEDITKGVVIEDVEAGDSNTRGNQYVWVPIGNVKYNTSGEVKTINFGRYEYEFETNSTGVMKQSADNYTEVVEIVDVDNRYIEVTSSNSGETVAKNLGDFITKAKNAGGYYIGRYEAGKVSENENTFNVKKGQEVYGSMTRPEAAELAQNLYSSNSNFESDLINSYAWDTAIAFIQTFSGDPDYSRQGSIQSSQTTTGNAHDDNNNYDVRCNIYDMAGNLYEWSTETCIDSSDIVSSYTIRGGYYNSSDLYTAMRARPIRAAEIYMLHLGVFYTCNPESLSAM